MKEFPPFCLDTANECLFRLPAGKDDRIPLTPKAFAVLRCLVDRAGRLVTQEQLLESVWQGVHVQPQVVKTHILEIRSKLGDRAKNPLFIETLHRRGYRFIAPVRETSATAPAVTARTARSRLVGRDQALAQLDEGLRSALEDRRQIVFITGEPGIGKTALADEFQRRAVAEIPDLRIARGQCIEGYGAKEAFYPMLEALGQLSRGPGGNSVVEILSVQAPTWLVQFPAFIKPEQREMLQHEILGATRERMLREICDALDTLTSTGPLLLVFEDLQWADASTLDLMSALARRRAPAKLMLIATKRPVQMIPDHPLKTLKQDLLVHGLCTEIPLEPLSEAHVAEYLAIQSSGNPLPEGLARWLYLHSEGNPLFMVAALDHMIERKFVCQEGEAWKLQVPLKKLALEVPNKLRRMIESQIDQLTSEEQRVLGAASVAGMVFSTEVCATSASLAPEACECLCQEVSRHHHIVRSATAQHFPDGTFSSRYEFVHALYREVLYQRQAPRLRVKLHLLVAERLEELCANQRVSEAAPELAYHFEEGGDTRRAVKYLQFTADMAARRFEPRQAAQTLVHAFELNNRLQDAERVQQEITILEKLATIYAAALDPRAVETCEILASRAVQCGYIDAAVSGLLKLAWQLLVTNPDQCLRPLERALQLSTEHNNPLSRARTVVRWSLCSTLTRGWEARHLENCRTALKEIRQRASRLILGHSLIDYSFVQFYSSEYRSAHKHAVEGMTIIVQESENNACLNDVFLNPTILHWSLLFLGEWGEALHEIDRADEMMGRNADHPQSRAQANQILRAFVHSCALDFAGALEICDPLLASIDYRPHARHCAIVMASAELNLGNYARANTLLSAAEEDMRSGPAATDWYRSIMIDSARTDLCLAQGDLQQARQQAARFLDATLWTAERTWQALAWEANARVAMAAEEWKRATECIGEALSTMEGFEVPLAAWRVHASAADLCWSTGQSEAAYQYREQSRATILKLADSLRAEDPLRAKFLSAPSVRKVFESAELADNPRPRRMTRRVSRSAPP